MDFEEYYSSDEYETEDDYYEAETYLNTKSGPYPRNVASKNRRPG
jgi:hypothetical protein